MAFSDPQTVIVSGDTMSLPRVGSGPSSGVFSLPDSSLKLSVSHAVNKRARRTVRLDLQKVAPDPLFPASNVPYSASVYLVLDAPLTGFTISEQADLIIGLADYLKASSSAATNHLVGGES